MGPIVYSLHFLNGLSKQERHDVLKTDHSTLKKSWVFGVCDVRLLGYYTNCRFNDVRADAVEYVAHFAQTKSHPPHDVD